MRGWPRQSLVLVLAGVLLGAAAWGGVALLRRGDRGATWDYFRADRDELQIVKTVRACDEIVDAEADEAADRVEVTLLVDRGGTCGDIAVDKWVTLTLGAPLGDRAVYDAACLDDGGSEQECLRSTAE